MQVGTYGSLRDFAAKAPIQDSSFADTIRQKGQEIIKKSLSIYSDPNRSRADGDVAIDDLTDLERAIKQVVDRTKGETAANSVQIDSVVQGLNQTGVADGKLKAAALVHISTPAEAVLPGHTNQTSTAGLTNGELQYAQETAGAVLPAVDKMEGLSAFIRDLHGVAGLFSAAILAGPPVLTVANFAREESGAAIHEQSMSSFGSSSSDRSVHGLGLFGIKNAHSQSSGSSMSSTDGSFSSDKTSTDERIVPMMRDLMERIDQVSIYPAQRATVNGYQEVHGSRTDPAKPTSHRWFKHGEESKPAVDQLMYYGPCLQSGAYTTTYSFAPSLVRPLSTEAYEPAHLAMPLTGVSDYVK